MTSSERQKWLHAQDFVASRLDRLAERPRHLVATAAAIGRDFPFTLLARAPSGWRRCRRWRARSIWYCPLPDAGFALAQERLA